MPAGGRRGIELSNPRDAKNHYDIGSCRAARPSATLCRKAKGTATSMSDQSLTTPTTVRQVFSFIIRILGPESNYYMLALAYGIGIGVLSLSVPISVQMLVNTVANTGLATPLIVLSATLFGLLLAAGLLRALRIHLMDLFQRRFYARMVADITIRSIYALNPFFQDFNKGTLFNRYFDILVVQKNLPNLLIGGFTILLQAAVGFVLVSMYHPLFLVFNLILIGAIWVIWLIWGGAAIRSAVQVSHKKHAAAAWLEGLGASNGFFKSERHIAEALKRTDAVTAEYMTAHERHFRHHFAQTICFLLLYATASAALLGLGGWLVIQGQLSLGQLVAAELVLSVVFIGLSQLGIYLAYFYELCGAIDELALFYGVEQEAPEQVSEPYSGDGEIEFVDARGDARGRVATLNFRIPSGSCVLGMAATHGLQREVTNFLKRHIRPSSGYVSLGGQDIMSIQAYALRQQIIVLDRPNAVEMTIREYLRLSGRNPSSADIFKVLETVGLEESIAQLDEGLDTRVAATGWPLTITETMQLKLAAAIIANPKVLILGPLFDTMADRKLKRAIEALQADGETTVIYFCNRPRDFEFDLYLHLDYESQTLFKTFDELRRHADGDRRAEPAGSASSAAGLAPSA
jgi:putative ABC transport system ATP-binding protein